MRGRAAAPRAQLASLEAGRGVAAMLVVAVHTWDHCAQAYGPFALGRLFTFGHAGVDFFFVLSGFIILHVHGGDIGRPARLAHYAARRITRIFPLYWVASALLLASFALRGQPSPDLGELATSGLLLPTAQAPLLSVAWTLQQEVLFYALFGLLIVRWRLGMAAFALWLLLLLAAAVLPSGSLPAALSWDLPAKLAVFFNVEFFFGMAVAWICAAGDVPRPRWVLAAGVAAFLAIGAAEDAGLVDGPADLTHLGYGLAAAAVVLGLVGAERAGRLRVPRALARLGGASYAIYLTHLLSVGAAWQILLALHLDAVLPPWLVFLLLVAAAAVAGLVIAAALERPLIRLVRRIFAGRPVAAAPQAVSPP